MLILEKSSSKTFYQFKAPHLSGSITTEALSNTNPDFPLGMSGTFCQAWKVNAKLLLFHLLSTQSLKSFSQLKKDISRSDSYIWGYRHICHTVFTIQVKQSVHREHEELQKFQTQYCVFSNLFRLFLFFFFQTFWVLFVILSCLNDILTSVQTS